MDFTEGLFIDYRHFDQAGITPRFEFGFGLSYTTFEYSNLQIAPAIAPNSTSTASASATNATVNPTVCPYTRLNASAYTFPKTISSLTDYLYPYLAQNSSFTIGTPYPQASIVPTQPGTPGGALTLWNAVATISITVRNTGSVDAQEVAQLYLALGNGEPLRQLRGFNKTMIAAGESQQVSFQVVERDLSIWDVPSQSWIDVRTLGTSVGVYVGASSRDLRLNGTMPALSSSRPAGYTTGQSASPASASMPYVTEASDGQPAVTAMYS